MEKEKNILLIKELYLNVEGKDKCTHTTLTDSC